MSAVGGLTRLISSITISLIDFREIRPLAPTPIERLPPATSGLDFRQQASTLRFALMQDIRPAATASLSLNLQMHGTDIATGIAPDADKTKLITEFAQSYHAERPIDELDSAVVVTQNAQGSLVPTSTSIAAQFALAAGVDRRSGPQHSSLIPNNNRTSPREHNAPVGAGTKPIPYIAAVILLIIAAVMLGPN